MKKNKLRPRRKEIKLELGEIFNNLVKEWRKTSTQVKLAGAAGVCQGTISYAKKGGKWLEPDTVEDIARAMGIHPAYFYLADTQLTVAENKKIVNRLIELRDDLVMATLAKR